MRIKIQTAIVFNKFCTDDWFPPIFSIIALVPDRHSQETCYIFLVDNMKKFSFTIDKFPIGGLYIPDLMDIGLIKTAQPHKFVNMHAFNKCIERVPWKKVN